MADAFKLFALNRESDATSLQGMAASMLGVPSEGGTPPPQPQPQAPPPQQPQFPVFQPPPMTAPPPAPVVPVDQSWPAVQQRIFNGESGGGDYDALFGFSNRDGGAFAGTKLTEMSVDDALKFADPEGPYAAHVRGQVGRTATPLGAYQVVGSTLKAAKEALGLKGDEIMTPGLQDAIGKWVYKNQGTDAWEALKSPAQVNMPRRDFPSVGDRSTSDLESTLEPDDPKTVRRHKIAMGLMALGKGLGQMSQGQAVDVGDVLNDYLERQDAMKKRAMEIMMEKERRTERKEDIGIRRTEFEQTQDFQAAQLNAQLQQQAIMQGNQFGHEDATLANTQDFTLGRDAVQQAYGQQNAAIQQGYNLDYLGRQVAAGVATREDQQAFSVDERHANNRFQLGLAREGQSFTRQENRKGRAADVANREDTQAFSADQQGKQNEFNQGLQERGFAHDTGERLGTQEFQLNLKDRTEEANRKAFTAAAAGFSPEISNMIGQVGATNPDVARAMLENQTKILNDKRELDRQQGVYNTTADIYEKGGVPEAAKLARAGNFKAADELFRQLSGDKTTADIANFEYSKSLTPEDRAEWAIQQGLKAGSQPPGMQKAVEVEGERLKVDAKAMNNIQTQRDLLGQAMGILKDPSFESGPGSAYTLQLRKIGEQMGLGFEDGLTGEQVFDSIANHMISYSRQPGEGSTSDFDAERFKKGTIDLGKSPDANRAIAYATDRVLQQRQARYDAEIRYMAEGKTGTQNKGEKDAYVQEQLKAAGLDGDAIMEAKTPEDIDTLIAKGLQANQPFYYEGKIHFLNEDGTPR